MEYNKHAAELIHEGCLKHEKDQIELGKTFCGMNCPTYDEEGIERVVDILDQLMTSIGIEVNRVYDPGYGTHIIGRIRPENPTGRVIISAHIDTAFNKGDVEKHPYHVEGNRAYGLGVGDCKGGLILSLYAIKILKENGLLPNKEFTILFTCDEETGSFSGRKIYEKEAPGAEAAFVMERGRSDIGAGPITARPGMTEAKIETFGISSHGGRAYHLGASAVEEMAYKIIEMRNKNDYENKVFYSVGPVKSESHINRVPDYCVAELCTMLPTMETKESVERFLKGLEEKTYVPGCSTKVTMRFLYPPMDWSEKNSRLADRYVSAAHQAGCELKEGRLKLGTGDASFLTYYGVPTIDGLGPVAENSHQYDEYLLLDTIVPRTEALALTLMGLDEE